MKLLKLTSAAALALACALAAGWTQAAETAFTVRSTTLKAKPYSDAKTLAELDEKTAVLIVGRHGSWSKIKVEEKTGWVKMLSLRLGDPFQKTGDTGVKSLFSLASTGSAGHSTMTSGVRGLNEERLHDPKPNPQAFEELHTLAVSKEDAQKFARAGKLTAAKMDYLPAPAAK